MDSCQSDLEHGVADDQPCSKIRTAGNRLKISGVFRILDVAAYSRL